MQPLGADSPSLWMLGLGALLHLLLGLSFHLSPDEAHYALYAYHLDWSYYDHPPLVGWLQWPALHLLGGGDLAMRLLPMACWLLAAMGLRRLTLMLWPLAPAVASAVASAGAPAAGAKGLSATAMPAAHHLALALWLLSPLPHLLGLALVPDTLLLPLVPLTMGVVARLVGLDNAAGAKAAAGPVRAPLRLWLLLGLCLGLAGLAKYTAALLAVSALLALHLGYRQPRGSAAGSGGRGELGRQSVAALGLRLWAQPGPWMCAALAIALITPVLAWNAQHQWISFAYQFDHAAGATEPWLLRRLASFTVLQLLVYGLLPAWGCLVWRRSARAGRAADRAAAAGSSTSSTSAATAAEAVAPTEANAAKPPLLAAHSPALSPRALCLCFGLPLLGLLAWLSGRSLPLPHWAAPAWLALLPLAGAGLAARWPQWRLRLRAAMAWQAAGCVLMTGLLLAGGWATVPQPGKPVTNPVADLYGWDAAARRAAQLAAQQGLNQLAVHNWTLASRIAWYARPLPVQVVQRHDDQFDLWFGGLQPGDDALVVDWSLMARPAPVGEGRFRSCRLLERQEVEHLGRTLAHFNFQDCRGWQGPALQRPGQAVAVR